MIVPPVPSLPAAPSFTAACWKQAAHIRESIDHVPFLRELEDGTLDRASFLYYLTQDALYLQEYARALAAAADLAPTPEAAAFWAAAATETVAVESAMQERYLQHAGAEAEQAPTPSPTCTLYTSFLLAEASRGEYATLAAAVLPCFVVYEDVGRRLAQRVRARTGSSGGDDALAAHPFGDWIATYEDEAFTASSRRAAALVDEAAATASPGTRARMAELYVTAARCEWMFWDAAHRRETWPV